MAISFGDNLDKSFAYTNGAFKKFSGWFILIILSAIIYGATFAMVFALIAFFIGIFMAFPPMDAQLVTTVDTTTGLSTVDSLYYTAGADAMLSGLLIGGMLILMLAATIVMLLASFFLSGFILRVYRGEELNFKSPGKMFW
ncbi:MAG: hypothetical protein IJO35_01600, partial [Methanocorpusculum sp.]|nr:hypothetical protein [Methanocorpusculum sp.]